MQEVFPNVYMIPVPLTGNPLKELNCFVIMGSNRNLVVDVGFDTEEGRERIKSGLKELKCDPECTDLFITGWVIRCSRWQNGKAFPRKKGKKPF